MATATPTDKPENAAEPKKSKKKLFLILGVAAVLVLGLAGGGAFFYMKKKAAAEAEALAEAEADGTAAPKVAKRDRKVKSAFVALDTFTVNLADRDADRYAQVQLSLELNDEGATQLIKNFMPVIRNNILLVLSHKKAAELLEKDGKIKLSEEIKVEVARALGMEPPETDSQSAATTGTAAKGKPKAATEDFSPVVGVHFSNFIIQ
ncbi:MAG: flagellar basal body-associated FliL family protein [Rubrivivax sp.]|jgi:flagellar FliL protein|nr:flagellar basal body-associated FliL family protein [Rubrivivax sp.]